VSLSPTSVVFRRTNALFKDIDDLKRLFLRLIEEENGSSPASISEKSNLPHAGLYLRALNEYNIRNICGELLYGAGLQDYLHERVLQMKFSKNSLYGKIDDGERNLHSKESRKQSFVEASVTVDMNSNGTKYHTYGDCTCALSRDESSLCSHVAALLVAWVRRSQDFEETVKFDFNDAKRCTMDSLDKLVDSIEKSSSGSKDDMEVLGRTYEKLRLWAAEIVDAKNRIDLTVDKNRSQVAVREFSWTINSVSLAIMLAIENKYGIRAATELYNRTTVSNFGRVLEIFVQSPHLGKASAPSIPKKSSEGQGATLKSTVTTRSWDSLVESFADG